MNRLNRTQLEYLQQLWETDSVEFNKVLIEYAPQIRYTLNKLMPAKLAVIGRETLQIIN